MGASVPASLPLWLPEERAPALRALTAASPAFVASLDLGAAELWGPWATSEAPEAVGWPAQAQRGSSACTPWQRTCLIHAVRPDRTFQALSLFVGQALDALAGVAPAQVGQEAPRNPLAPAPTSIAALAAEASPSTPVLFVTTTGTDPSRELRDFAAGRSSGGSGGSGALPPLVEIAMGGGVARRRWRAWGRLQPVGSGCA